MQSKIHLAQHVCRACRSSLPARLALYLGIGAWLLYGDPFGLASNSDQAFSEAYQRVSARMTGVPIPPVSVVTINLDDIRELHKAHRLQSNDWPLTYNDHATILAQVLAPDAPGTTAPAAVFYDIHLQDYRNLSGSLDRLKRLTHRIAEDERLPTLLLAAGGVDTPMSQRMRETLPVSQLTPSNWRGRSTDYALATPLKANASPRDSGALGLYRQWAQIAGMPPLHTASDEHMAIQWRLSDRCVARGIFERTSELLHYSVSQLFSSALGPSLSNMLGIDLPAEADASCLPFHQITLRNLVASRGADLPPPGAASYVVMVGVDDYNLGDFRDIPVYSQLAGIFTHAMAFENLFRMQQGYLRYEDMTWMAMLAWIITIALIMRSPPTFERNNNALLRSLAWFTFTATSVALTHHVFHTRLNLVPEGWLPLLAIAPLAREIIARHEAHLKATQELA
ncbi:CHASE2 domain-containing protein [Halomonas sp. H10-59]|uniref:CHASE2 domain-containing protein n=1 Tax=Halomonas sp. H10-59 TaxID=2950874 RepID=A0AAU7KXB5_9GAMM|nr:CHASE2 domain-containing protein [Halomonas sp. DP1Y21-3]MBY6109193.1 CHASE2 domain-containing protein [Halomonas sp. DP1Y21-3]